MFSFFPNLPDEKIAAEIVQSLPAAASEGWNHRFGGGGEEDVGRDQGGGGDLLWHRVHRAQPHRLPAWYAGISQSPLARLIFSQIVSEFRALLLLPASPLLRRSSRKMGNGGEDGKGMQVNDDDIHCQFCLSPMQFQGQGN